MKKVFLAFVAMVALTFASCGNGSAVGSDTCDSTAVDSLVVDTTVVDTVAVDSIENEAKEI